MNLTKLGVLEFLDGLKQKKFSVLESTQEFANLVKNDKRNAFITKTTDEAIANAKQIDEKIAKEGVNKLSGVSAGVKDVFCTNGVRTTCGSKMLENFIPSYESTVTAKLWQNDAIMIGKLNMDEFSMGSSGQTSYFGPAINVYKDKTRLEVDLVPGGSSSGSAVAVASDYCHFALGGDTGGSIKQPASFCNLVGLKPTYGRCSRYGMIPYCDSLDQAGVLGKNVEDVAYIFDIISGQDGKDLTMYEGEKFSFEKCFENFDLQGVKIGNPVNISRDGMMNSISRMWDDVMLFLEKRGAIIKDITIDHIDLGVEVYYTITTADAFSNLAKYDGIKFGYSTKDFNSLDEFYTKTRGEGFGEEVKRRIMLGAYTLSAEHFDTTFMQAAKIKRMIYDSYVRTFNDVDLIITPTTPNVAFGMNDVKTPIEMYLNDVLTIPSNLAGLGGLSVPAGFDDLTGLPMGIQLIPRWFDEKLAFNIGKIIQSEFKKE
jgi:aspartyl-tRNA(Asn)/glutamyl-tRNA(Gln) amidotransferase subunit A